MPRRRPSFVPLLVFAVVFAHAAARHSADAQPPPDVPESILAPADSLLTEDTESTLDPSADPAAPILLSPDAESGDFEQTLSSSSDSSSSEPSMYMEPPCAGPRCPFKRLKNLAVCGFDWVFHPPPRHRGIGQPLARESWQFRPFSLGLFAGYIRGGTLIDDWTGSSDGALGGFRLGWDPGYYWGCEFRYAAASLGQWDSFSAQKALLEAEGTYDSHRDVNMDVWDFCLLYYPWGDSAWRPYLLAGLGGSQLRFDDCMSEHWSDQVFAMPLALGVKYRYNSRLALRFEVGDNIVFGIGRVDTVHHLSVTGGLELRLGGTRNVYWPWSRGRHYW